MNPIIKECLENGIHVELSLDGYEIRGFAKSGYGVLSFEPEEGSGAYTLTTRYGNTDHIRSFQELVAICFDWCEGYQSRGYGWDWPEVFIKYGYLKEKTVKILEPSNK